MKFFSFIISQSKLMHSNEPWYQTAVSDFKILKNWKSYPKNIILKKSKKIFRIYQKQEHIWKKPVGCMCEQNFQVDIMKNSRALTFWRPKRSFFTLFFGISVYFQFSNFLRFQLFKKCSWVIFRVVNEKLT